MSWLFNWLRTRRPSISKTFLFSWPDASRDRCLVCAVERRYHQDDHSFVEVGEKQC